MYFCIIGICASIALVAATPNGSLLAVLGALLFVGSSLALLALFVVSLVRSVRLRTFHGQQLLAGGLLLVLILFAVQRLDRPSPETKIERVIGVVATSTNPAYCVELTTERYLEQTTGVEMPFADDACESDASQGAAESVEVREIAIDGGRASAIVANTGGSFDGSQLEVRLVEQGGDWRLDRLVGFADFDREKFRLAYARKLQALDFPDEAVECVLGQEEKFSGAQVERAVLSPADNFFASIAVDCYREGVERSVLGPIEDPAFDFPESGVKCAERRIRMATDAELVQLQFDIPTYNRLLLSCDRRAFFDYYRQGLAEVSELDRAAVVCVMEAFRGRSTASLIHLIYEQSRYEALIDACERRS
jgi:hypothetical protein